jgi:hypothetical protein
MVMGMVLVGFVKIQLVSAGTRGLGRSQIEFGWRRVWKVTVCVL